MSEDNRYSNVIDVEFEEYSWPMNNGTTVFLSGSVEIDFAYERYSKSDDWSLEDVDIAFTDISAKDEDGEEVALDPLDTMRAEAYLLGHKQFNDWIDGRMSDDFNSQ